ncbi:hypothetical protein TcasGA2_TC003522 [Tribolium castaneum]|uniref:Uncharacterized protein n=1 Tax=Tribolium castaneum TaxID=7070 RepID=D6WHD4_TRICA|nr:PREDICTED: uncharacterized protein LOC103312346 [Tribolium castaneum]EFA00646.2 hypothetical protein TcasGA2_TC003522 [Tribolium castaneum]|eukprot:XP_008190989.1 PREDICTED: uncharacterized protein LOC103312346 [Tribolium castaneum]
MSGNRSKKNGKKNRFFNIPEVLQVKSVKLDTNKSSNKDGKPNAKSEDNLRKSRRFNNTLKNQHEGLSEESCLRKFKTLSLNNEGENAPSTSSSMLKNNLEESCAILQKASNITDEELPLAMEYYPEGKDDTADKMDDEFACTYKYYAKNTKSIKFTNQVTVLYFNGEDILCESMEPLKKEQDQQLRNKEMRKEHLLSKGQIDNLYLY